MKVLGLELAKDDIFGNASNLHSETSASGPSTKGVKPSLGKQVRPDPPGAMQHERGQTFTRKQVRPDPPGVMQHERGQTFTRKQVRPDPPRSNAARKGSNLHSETSASGPPPRPEQCSTKGVKPSLGSKCVRTPPPAGAMQHERGQTFTRKQVRPDPPPGAMQHERGQTFTRKQVRPDPPGAMQHEGGQTFTRKQVRQTIDIPIPSMHSVGINSDAQAF